MNAFVNCPMENETSIWLQNLVCGHSGLLIKVKQPVFCGSSPFQKVEVFDTYRFGLTLCLGGTVVLTERDYEPYHEMMVHPAMLAHPDPKQVCIIGGGDGGCLKEALKYKSVERVVVVEIDSLVKETVENYMPCFAAGFSDPRTEVVIDDGYDYFKDTLESFDAIFVDSYDPGGPVRSLETADFFGKVAASAGEGGIVVVQTDSPILQADAVRRTIANVSAVFNRYKPYICTLRSFPEGICSFLIATNSQNGFDNGIDENRYSEIADTLEYYNEDMGASAFMLPQNIKAALSF
jgi:spermidine synthase